MEPGKRKRGGKDKPSSAQPASKKQKPGLKSTTTSTAENPTETPDLTILGDRKKEAALYNQLADEDYDIRNKAALVLIGLLVGDGTVGGAPEADLRRHLETRILRGLASGRNAARLGLSLVLTEVLWKLYGEDNLAQSRYPNLPFEKAVQALVESTQPAGGLPGQEEKNHYLGQLFGLESFVKAKIVLGDDSRWSTLLDLLLKLGQKKVWLRSQCGWVIVQAIRQLPKAHVEGTLRSIDAAGLSKTPEGVASWLEAVTRFPDLDVKPWKHPLATKTLQTLVGVLKESVEKHNEENPSVTKDTSKQPNSTAQLHFVWPLIVAYYDKQGNDGEKEFAAFWGRVIDDSFFSKSATPTQKFRGFSIFQLMLEGLAQHETLVNVLFSQKLMSCLMNQSADEGRYVHRAATKALKAIEATASTNRATVLPMLRGLLGGHGTYSFDQRTKTKTIENILLQSRVKDLEHIVKVLELPEAGTDETSSPTANVHAYVGYLSKLMDAEVTEVGEVASSASSVAIERLIGLAYMKQSSMARYGLTDDLKSMCRSRLESCLAKMSRRSGDARQLCRAVAGISRDDVDVDEEIETELKAALKNMGKLSKADRQSQDGAIRQGLALLYAVSILQLYNGDADAVASLVDLKGFYERLRKGKTGQEEDNDASILFVEVLLAMAARASPLTKLVSKQVFEAFTPLVSAQALELLTGPLDAEENTEGHRALFEADEDVAMSDEHTSDENDEDGESHLEIDSNGKHNTGLAQNEHSSDDSDDSTDDGEEDNDDEEGLSALHNALAQVLQSRTLADADGEESESESDMTDSEMLALDDKLVDAFRVRVNARGPGKKAARAARTNVIDFKSRVLELLEIYIRSNSMNQQTFSLLPHLVRLCRTTSAKHLASRASEIVANHQKAFRRLAGGREKDVKDLDMSTLLQEFEHVLDEVTVDSSQGFAKIASSAALTISSALVIKDKGSCVKELAQLFAQKQAAWVMGDIKVHASFFTNWVNWCQSRVPSNGPGNKAGRDEEQ